MNKYIFVEIAGILNKPLENILDMDETGNKLYKLYAYAIENKFLDDDIVSRLLTGVSMHYNMNKNYDYKPLVNRLRIEVAKTPGYIHPQYAEESVIWLQMRGLDG